MKSKANEEHTTIKTIDRKKDMGIRMRRVRVARGLSQEDVAEACEVTRAARPPCIKL